MAELLKYWTLFLRRKNSFPWWPKQIANFNTLFQITHSERDHWLIDDRIQRVTEKSCGKNSSSCVCLCRFERALNPYTDKSGSFGKLTDVLISYTHQKQGVIWRFPGSPRFSRSWTSERLVFGVKCASDRRHKQARPTAKTFLLLSEQKLVSLGAEIDENFRLTPMFCFRLLNSTNWWRNPASSSKTVTKR